MRVLTLICCNERKHNVIFELHSEKSEKDWQTVGYTLFFFYKNVVFPAHAEYSYFSADFKLKIFLYYS